MENLIEEEKHALQMIQDWDKDIKNTYSSIQKSTAKRILARFIKLNKTVEREV